MIRGLNFSLRFGCTLSVHFLTLSLPALARTQVPPLSPQIQRSSESEAKAQSRISSAFPFLRSTVAAPSQDEAPDSSSLVEEPMG